MMSDFRVIRMILQDARTELRLHEYQNIYIARDRKGRSCSPMKEGFVQLSFHGAIIRACRNNKQQASVFAWLTEVGLLPKMQPATKEDCLEWFDRTIRRAELDINNMMADA